MAYPKKPFGGAKKSFGQNFLIDGGVVTRILDAAAVTEGDRLIEIGPGRGALTGEMLARGAVVTAVELERDVIAFLKAEFGDAAGLTLVEGDALRIDFTALGDVHVKLVANLPYNISTAILQRLTEFRESFSVIVLMFQREVVERITAAPGTPARGFLSVLAQRYFSAEHLFDVPPQAFRPVPKVTSSVCRLIPSDFRSDVPDALFRVVSGAAFAQRRKTIANNLRHSPDTILKTEALAILADAEIDGQRRAETLTNDEWERLAGAFAARKST